ncbi:MAG: hypothetical protein JNK11_09110 [Alphaproteobacteria bacterium]|nr:hypothetical protein [Alphaproteobacteria bacterium]
MTGQGKAEGGSATPASARPGAGRPGGSDLHRRQRGKNIAVFLSLIALAVLIYVTSILRMGGH